MLIKCTECGKEISDKAHACPNCGYPISQYNFANGSYVCKIDGKDYDFTEIVDLFNSGYPFQAITNMSKVYTNDTDKKIIPYLIIYFEEHRCFPNIINTNEINISKKDINDFTPVLIRYQKEEKITKQKSKICPKCGSTEFIPLRKKWSLLAGFATNKVDMVCSKCGTVVK